MEKTVQCAANGCTRSIPAARAKLPVSNGMCADCNEYNLPRAREEREPEYYPPPNRKPTQAARNSVGPAKLTWKIA
jgi:hypothetical protein